MQEQEIWKQASAYKIANESIHKFENNKQFRDLVNFIKEN